MSKVEANPISDNPAINNQNSFSSQYQWKGAKLSSFAAIFLLALFCWQLPPPTGLAQGAWHLFIIFFATIVGVIAKPMPMGSISILAIVACVLTNTLTIEKGLSSFSSPIVWLIVSAFLIAKGFIKTGLGARISYYFIMFLGRSTIGLSYGFIISELLLAPFIPSNTARGAGVIFPVLTSLSKEYQSYPNSPSRRKIGAYLTKVCFQTNVITSAMFITAMAANPLIVSIAADMGHEITWITWALASVVPGLFCLAILPFIFYFIYPPEIKSTPEAPFIAQAKLQELGKIKVDEILMLTTFAVLLTLWIFGPMVGIEATSTALFGLSILLFSGVLSWEDIISEKEAWNTFIWLSVLLSLVKGLSEFGAISWFSNHIKGAVSEMDWLTALVILAVIYYYAHYLFASMTSHISSLFSAFTIVVIASGAPALPTLLIFAAISSLSAGLTHFGTGTAPVYFSSGYVTLKEWWKLGGIMSVIHILAWLFLGLWWWKVLGIW